MTNTTLRKAIVRFRDEVYVNAKTIDLHQECDWNDIAMGFLLACGVPNDTLTWYLLSDLSHGNFDPYLEPARVWAQAFLRANPKYVTVRVGHGYDASPALPGKHVAWADPIDAEGQHLAASQDNPLPSLPDDVTQWVIDNVPLGEWIDFTRKPESPP